MVSLYDDYTFVCWFMFPEQIRYFKDKQDRLSMINNFKNLV